MPNNERTTGLKVVQRKGRTTLYIRGTVRGISIFESAGTDDRALAEEARSTREAELFRGALHGFRSSMTFAGAALSYIQTVKPSRDTLAAVGKLAKHFGPTILCSAVDQAAIDRAGRTLCRATAKPATIQRTVTTPVAAVLNHAARRGWCDPPRFERAKASGKRTDWLTPAEAEAMIAAAAEHLKPLLTFLFCTGARLGEALSLTWDDVDLQHGRATLRDTKNGDDRLMQLPLRAVAALAQLERANEGSVFRHRGQAYRRDADSPRHYGGQIKRGWGTALRAAGIRRKLTPHHARHSFATWFYAAHKDLMKLRDAGGWKSIAMVERYAKLAPEGTGAEALAFWGVTAVQVIERRSA